MQNVKGDDENAKVIILHDSECSVHLRKSFAYWSLSYVPVYANRKKSCVLNWTCAFESKLPCWILQTCLLSKLYLRQLNHNQQTSSFLFFYPYLSGQFEGLSNWKLIEESGIDNLGRPLELTSREKSHVKIVGVVE